MLVLKKQVKLCLIFYTDVDFCKILLKLRTTIIFCHMALNYSVLMAVSKLDFFILKACAY